MPLQCRRQYLWISYLKKRNEPLVPPATTTVGEYAGFHALLLALTAERDGITKPGITGWRLHHLHVASQLGGMCLRKRDNYSTWQFIKKPLIALVSTILFYHYNDGQRYLPI